MLSFSLVFSLAHSPHLFPSALACFWSISIGQHTHEKKQKGKRKKKKGKPELTAINPQRAERTWVGCLKPRKRWCCQTFSRRWNDNPWATECDFVGW
jgi:hypothetical protein